MSGSAAKSLAGNPHGNKGQATARVVPGPDLSAGDIEVRLAGKETTLLEGNEVTLSITHQSIAAGNSSSVVTTTSNLGGVARFPAQKTETDYVYKVTAAIGEARYSSQPFQFRSGVPGMRVLLPVHEASSDVNALLILSRALYAVIPQDNLFSIDVLWRIENYSDKSWLPDEKTVVQLPKGATAITIREATGDGRIEAVGEAGIRLAGTFAPGQQDLALRFHMPADGNSERQLAFPTPVHLGSARIILDSSPTMSLKVEGFSEPSESRNQDGQRRLISSFDYLGEKVKAPEKILVLISGVPTPAKGRTVAVGLAAALALVGLGQGVGRFRSRTPTRSSLSKEDRERAGELLLEELIRLEQAFKHGEIGRKTHEAAKRQLLEAYARLGTT
jgi:hypothetical protein